MYLQKVFSQQYSENYQKTFSQHYFAKCISNRDFIEFIVTHLFPIQMKIAHL